MAQAESKKSQVLWILVLAAVIFLWWYLRPQPDDAAASAADIAADTRAAIGADPDDLLIDLRDDVSPAQVADVEADLGIDLQLVSDQSADEQFYRAHVDAARAAAVLAALVARPEVELAEHDAMYALTPTELQAYEVQPPAGGWAGFPNDPLYSKQWHMRQIGMPKAWQLADGGGVIVAVIDTGVAYETFGRFHQVEDLAGLEFVKPYDFVNNKAHGNDDHGHGTHVAGTIAQVTHNGKGVAGVARNVKIMPLKVLGANGSGSVAGIADAIRYAADNGAKVINMSLGGAFPSRVLKKAVEYAYNKGVVVVCAAGNESRGVGYPAAYPGAFAVSATQEDEATTFYSNYGKEVDIAAPGGNTRGGDAGGVLQNTIVVGNPEKSGYFAFMGTSMASPHVAGVAALVVGEGVTNPAMVEQILKDTARKPSGKQKYTSDRYGAGIVDAPAAVLAARSKHGGAQAGLALLLAAAVAASARRRSLGGLGVKLGAGFFGASAFTAGGLFFLPWLAGGVSSWWGVEALTRGVPSLDMALFGPLAHGNPLFMSALIPLALVAVAGGVPRLRGVLAGLAVGVAAHLLFFAAVPVFDLRHVPGATLDTLWLVGNALVCAALAVLTLRR
jgi:serine protease